VVHADGRTNPPARCIPNRRSEHCYGQYS
jgi:hypothetical protein